MIPEPYGWDMASIGISGSNVEELRLATQRGVRRTIRWYGSARKYDSEILVMLEAVERALGRRGLTGHIILRQRTALVAAASDPRVF